MCTAQEVMSRLEMLIVLAEMYEEKKLDVPCEVISAMDFIGPKLMTSAREQLKLSGLGMAKLLLDQRAKLFTTNGMPAPDLGPVGKLVDILAEVLGPQASKANGAKTDIDPKLNPLANEDGSLNLGGADGIDVHVFVVKGEKKDGAA